MTPLDEAIEAAAKAMRGDLYNGRGELVTWEKAAERPVVPSRPV